MKKTILFLGLISLFLTINTIQAQTVDVTFRVDMQEQTVAPEGVHIAGAFPAPYPTWTPDGILLDTPGLGSVYTITLQLVPNTTIEFKYINGNAWGQDENMSNLPCAIGSNRFIEIAANDTILPVVCYGKCLPCILPPQDITFQVDMSNETVTGNVYISGFFNGWDPTANQLTDQGNNIYSTTLTLGEGEYIEYKFVNSTSYEGVPAGCAANGNRYYTVPAMNETIPLVCFGQCGPCTTVVPVDVIFQVDMSEQVVVPEGVHIAGSFQGWATDGTLMNDDGNGIWSYTFTLNSGDYHEYKFLNGDAWGEDETVPGECAQNNNRFITVPGTNTTLPEVCYGSCVICEPPTFDVTFSVDMSTQIVSDSGVHLAGSFQGWNADANEMIDMGNNIYELVLPVGEGELHEYKFINGNDFLYAENVPGECAGLGGNREFIGPSSNMVIPTVCFAECAECTTTLYEFNLSVMLEGPFNGTSMNTTLFNEGVLSVNQPFNTAPWDYDGTEELTALPETEVVDWLYIQFRDTDGDASTATSDKMIDHQAAILLADGTIARPDGSPNIYFNGNITDNLYMVIYHRNHLSVMSATPLVEIFGVYAYNFTNGLSKAYLDGQTSLGGGMYGMIGGDSDASGMVDLDDKDVNWTTEAGGNGYFQSDLNLDTQVNNPDKNAIWEPNDGVGTQVPL